MINFDDNKIQQLCKSLILAIARQSEPVEAIEIAMETESSTPLVRHYLDLLVTEGKLEKRGDLYYCDHSWQDDKPRQQRRCIKCDRTEPFEIVTETGTIVASEEVNEYQLLKAYEADVIRNCQIAAEAMFEAAKSLKEIRDRKLYRFEHKNFSSYINKTFGFTRDYACKQIRGSEVFEDIKNANQKLKDKVARRVDVYLKAIENQHDPFSLKAESEIDLYGNDREKGEDRGLRFQKKSTSKYKWSIDPQAYLPTSERQIRNLSSLSTEDRLEIWYTAVRLSLGDPSARTIDDLARSKKLEISNRQPVTDADFLTDFSEPYRPKAKIEKGADDQNLYFFGFEEDVYFAILRYCETFKFITANTAVRDMLCRLRFWY